MKIKSLFVSLVLLAMGGSLSAQTLTPASSSTGSITTNAANCNTTNACIILHLASSNVGYSVTVSGTWTGTLTVEQSGDNQGSWTSATTTTANTLFTSALTPGITDVRVRGSAAMTGTAVVTITASGPATLQQITQTGGSSSSSSPNASTIYAWDPKYNLPQPAKWVCDITTTVGSAIVTTPATDRPFLPTDSYAVVWGGRAQCGGNPETQEPLLTNGVVTATYNSAHQITLSSNAVLSCTPTAGQGGCALVWGADATAAVQAAFNDAANACGSLKLPASGLIFNSVPVINTTGKCPSNTGGNDQDSGIDIGGQGQYTTVLLFSPNVSFATGSMFGVTNLAGIRVHYHDFQASSFVSAFANQSAQIGFSIFFNSEFDHISFFDFFPSDTTGGTTVFTALAAQGVANAITRVHDNLFLNAGSKTIQFSNFDLAFNNNWLQGGSNLLELNNVGRFVSTGNRISLAGTQGALNINSGASDLASNNDYFNGAGTSLAVIRNGVSGAIATFHNVKVVSSQTSGPALSTIAGTTTNIDGESSSLATSQGTANAVTNAGTLTLRNVALASTGGAALSNSGTVLFKGGNSIGAGGLTNTGVLQVTPEGGYQGTCTGVVTSGATVGLYGLGQTTGTTCTITTVGSGVVASKAGTIYALYCTATAGNQVADACTVVKNGVAQTMTCSLNAVPSCTDGAVAHQVAYVAGDILGIEVIAGAATTLATVKGLLVAN